MYLCGASPPNHPEFPGKIGVGFDDPGLDQYLRGFGIQGYDQVLRLMDGGLDILDDEHVGTFIYGDSPSLAQYPLDLVLQIFCRGVVHGDKLGAQILQFLFGSPGG